MAQAPPLPYAAPPYGAPSPYPYPSGPPLAAPKTSPMAIWAFVLVIALGVIGALVAVPLAFKARAKIRRSNGALKGSGLALAAQIIGFVYFGLVLLAIAIPTFIGVTHSGPTVQTLDNSVQNQITAAPPDGFDVPGISDVSCQPPSRWTTGSTFTCIAYGAGGEVGRYFGTVSPNAPNGTHQWYGRYYPSA
jgi:hypothetical protein